MLPIKNLSLPRVNIVNLAFGTGKAANCIFFLALAILLAGCRPQSTPSPSPTTLPPTPSFTPPTKSLPIPTPSPFVAPIGTSAPIPYEPFPLPAFEYLTVSLPDGSSLVVVNYTCPRAQATTGAPVYGYRVVNTYPHDPGAYTQGLIYRDGVLYESTGKYGASSLRKVRLEDGQVLQQRTLSPEYFGEGLTEMGGKIYQLTWKENTGFVVDLQTFELLDSFSYPTQGWGLTHDGSRLIMSDGTGFLYFLDPAALEVIGTLAVFDEFGPLSQLNELEFVNGEVWANLYQSSCVARIDLQSGKVTGWVDLTGLLAPEDLVSVDVPNGIAHDPASGRIFVTGKFWPRLFEIELVQK